MAKEISELFFETDELGAIIIMPEIKNHKTVPGEVREFLIINRNNWMKPKLEATPHGVGIRCRQSDPYLQDQFRYDAGEHFECIVRPLNGQFSI